MAPSSEKGQMPNLSAEEVASLVADTKDLTDVPGTQLRKLNQGQASEKEHQGAIYKDLYRQLQITPALHDRFYLQVLRIVRNKHIDDLKRGSEASIRTLTDLLLRGFGGHVWEEYKGWLLPVDQLDEGEERLNYVRGDSEHNARFYQILANLWPRMRNVIFEIKAAPKKRGRSTGEDSPALSVDTEFDSAYLGDTDTHGFPSPSLPFHRPGAAHELRTRVLATRLSYETHSRNKPMSRKEAGAAIEALIVEVADIRAHTDPRIFEELWERYIGRLEELDHPSGLVGADQDSLIPTTEASEQTMFDATPPQAPPALSSEPFTSNGNPIPQHMPLSALVPTTPPSHMSIWISTCGVLSTSSLFSVPLVTASTMYSEHTSARSTGTTCSQAYHWPNAPVQNYDLGPFFLGVIARVDPPTSSILGWILSYGWNDRCRFIPSGLTQLMSNDEQSHGEQPSSDAPTTNGTPDPEAMDIDDAEPPFQDTELNNGHAAESAAAIAAQNADFDQEQWNTIKLGWRDFQHDLREAARMGVRLWRMKVCVLNLTP
ncbi:hypothetical protein LTR84_002184 [Exophiala bonariae]|uniref:Uncharacterized protein n=1 Tax=Exophiala bonariae TaxID=1690606 RepID=A0AAV9NF71_9EURO|nr:hypothetical protein LTR84_002184 [Exophiala bonariae]